MKFLITRTSDCYSKISLKDFKTIEDLIHFKEIIIREHHYYDYKNKIYHNIKGLDNIEDLYTIPYIIEIYDDYRE